MFAAVLHTVTAVLAACVALGVQASPVSRRDVIAPTITSPTADSVWPVGSTQTVTWDTSNFPPVSQITNILGQVILGFEANNSLNLDFNNPLAQNFNITDGSVQITVPNVTPRDDYLIVLFGDSGDTSPAFSITRISAPADPPNSSAPSPTSGATAPTNPPSPPTAGSTTSSGESTSTTVSPITDPVTTADTNSTSTSTSAPTTTPTAPSTTSSASGTGTALGASTTTSAARALRPAGGMTLQTAALCVGAALSALVLL